MLIQKEMTIPEIEVFLRNKGDYVQIDLLTRFLQEKTKPEVRKFAFMRLGEIYERSSMFPNAGRNYKMAGELSTGDDKKHLTLKAVQMFIRASDFSMAEALIRNLTSKSSDRERKEIYEEMKKFYIYTSEIFEKTRKLGEAVKIYEKILTMPEFSDDEKRQVKPKLMELYNKLGKIKEYMDMKRNM
jgi:hypothetical protein